MPSLRSAVGAASLTIGALLCFFYNPVNLWYMNDEGEGYRPALVSSEDAWGVSLSLSTDGYAVPDSLSKGLYPWKLLVEPHRTTNMEITTITRSSSSPSYFSWTIARKDAVVTSADSVVTHSPKNAHVFTEVGMHIVRVDEVHSVTKATLHSFTTDVMCKCKSSGKILCASRADSYSL